MSAPSDQLDPSLLRPIPSAVRLVPGDANTDGAAPDTLFSDKAASRGNGRHYPSTGSSVAKWRDGIVSEKGPPTSQGSSAAEPSAALGVNAGANLAATLSPQNRGRQSRQSFSSNFSDIEPPSFPSRGPSPSGAQSRPGSRRSKFVAVLNEDKTFSLVPQASRDSDLQPPPSLSQYPPRSSSGLSDYSNLGLKSPQLHSFPTTPRVSQASTYEAVSSYASSHYDRPSSSLAETIPDRSLTPATPVPSSPGSSYQETITETPVVDRSDTSWIGHMVGGLRRVPNLPDGDAKGKQPAHSQASDTPQSAPQPDVSETDTPSRHDHPPMHMPPDGSRTPSTSSDNTNYKVYRHASEATLDPEPHASDEDQAGQGSDESLVDPHLRPQPSFATAKTGSTDFETANYKVYGHSDDEGSDEALAESPTVGPSARALRNPYAHHLKPQDSIASFQSAASSTSENTNYRVYGPSSPNLEPVPESPVQEGAHELRPAQSFLSAVSSLPESANYVVYGNDNSAISSVESLNHSPPSAPVGPSLYTQAEEDELQEEEEAEEGLKGRGADKEAAGEEAESADTAVTQPNYKVYGDPTPELSRETSPNTSESGGTVVRRPREEYSQESLVVSPLRPRRPSIEGFGYFTARSRSKSREELKTKKSLKSTKSSVSSVINEEQPEDFLASQAYWDALNGEDEATSPSVAGPSERQKQLDEQRERERQLRETAEWQAAMSAPSSEVPIALQTTPHQWSSQLSTVMSETEPESSSDTRGSLGSISLPGSHGSRGSHERRGSRGWSTHSRQMLSISSSLAAEMEAVSRSRSNSQPGSIERPSPSLRPGFHGMIRDQDEHGDGLGDLQQISPRPSRSRLSESFSNSNSSERNLHSSASMRSFSNTIPLWAKVYYGSGERRFLRSTSISSMSDFSSRPGSGLQYSMSPVSDQFPHGIYSPRRRPKDGPGGQRRSMRESMEIESGPTDNDQSDLGFRRSIRRITSSLWSPHLRRDVRARYSIWDTPSVAWSAESGMFGRRNLQVVLFVTGFIFPFSWMIAAVLPLPQPSPLAMVQRDSSYSDLTARTRSHEYDRHIESVDELRYENARWWRMLNRCMSVIGILIIGAVIGLVVAAVKEGWGTSS